MRLNEYSRWSRSRTRSPLYRAADRRSVASRIALFDNRPPARASAGIAIELRRQSQHRVRHAACLFSPRFATYFQEPVATSVDHPVRRRAVCRPALGIGILAAGVILAIVIIPTSPRSCAMSEQTPAMMKERPMASAAPPEVMCALFTVY